jgi:hypothetical protein
MLQIPTSKSYYKQIITEFLNKTNVQNSKKINDYRYLDTKRI